jgi:hypothetical protein
MQRYKVVIELPSGKLTLEIFAPVGVSDDELYDLAFNEIMRELEISKLFSYSEIKE